VVKLDGLIRRDRPEYCGCGRLARSRWCRGTFPRRCRQVSVAFPVVAAAGLGVTLWTWLAIPSVDDVPALHGPVTMSMGDRGMFDISDVVKDDLWARGKNVALGFYLGASLMLALMFAILIAVPQRRAAHQ
jgi:hypothetical protein